MLHPAALLVHHAAPNNLQRTRCIITDGGTNNQHWARLPSTQAQTDAWLQQQMAVKCSTRLFHTKLANSYPNMQLAGVTESHALLPTYPVHVKQLSALRPLHTSHSLTLHVAARRASSMSCIDDVIDCVQATATRIEHQKRSLWHAPAAQLFDRMWHPHRSLSTSP
jgi:hypothetical protein